MGAVGIVTRAGVGVVTGFFPTGTSCSGVTTKVFSPARAGTPKALGGVRSRLHLHLCQFSVPLEHPAFHKTQFCAVPRWDFNQEDLALCSEVSLKALVGLPGAVPWWHSLSCLSLVPRTGKNQTGGRKGIKNSNC